MPNEPCSGFVLAGGKSSRMGQNKAFLTIAGEPLVVRIARELAAVTGSVTLVGEPGLYAGLGFEVIPDGYPGCGPLAGIHAALQHARHDWSLVAACDMPVSAHIWGELTSRSRSDSGVIMAVDEEGRPEPLAALYHRRCASVIEEALAAGRYKVTDALAGLHVVQVPFEGAAFRNLNTPEQWRQFVSQHE
jgi:molybdenum cofactor guanylyltransferase